jgi:hypothetical protein
VRSQVREGFETKQKGRRVTRLGDTRHIEPECPTHGVESRDVGVYTLAQCQSGDVVVIEVSELWRKLERESEYIEKPEQP